MTAHPLPKVWTDLPRGLRDAVLKKLVERRLRQGAVAPRRLSKADPSAPVPASLEQAFFLGQQKQFGGRLAWTIAAPPIILDEIDPQSARRAIEALARRHDVLHTTFREAGGRSLMQPEPDRPAPFAVTTLPLTAALTGAEGWVRRRYDAMLAQPFDPQDGPLWRAELVARAGRGVMLLTFCSLIVDGESLHLIDRDLRALLAAPGGAPLVAPAFTYADYAATQAELMRAGHFDGVLAWWRERLAGGPPAVWADGRTAIAPAPLHEQVLGPETGRALDAFAAARRTTPHVVLLTEFMSLLRDIDQEPDLWVASATSARDRAGTEAMVGTFARQVLLRFSWPSAVDPIAGVHAMLAETMDQEPVPHLLVKEMLEAAYPGAPSAFRYVFNHRLVGPNAGEDEENRDVAYRAGPKHAIAEREEDILFMALQSGERRRLHWYLRADRFDARAAEALLARFHKGLLRRIGAQ